MQLQGCIDPEADRILCVGGSFCGRIAVRHASWQVGHFDNEHLVVLTPVDGSAYLCGAFPATACEIKGVAG
jgi:hypothetical protein